MKTRDWTVLALIVVAASALAMDKGHRPTAAVPRVATGMILTDFECMEAGESGDVLCWPMDGREVCIEGVDGDYVTVDTGLEGFGAASVGHQRVPCISDVSSHLRLTFDPPPTAGWQMNVARDSDGELRVVCWTDPDAEGDESRGIVFEPRPGDDTMPVGTHTTPGVAVCEVHGVVDNIGTY